MRSGELRLGGGEDFNINPSSRVNSTTLVTHSLKLKRNSSLPWKEAQDQRTNQWLSGHVARATFASI